MREEVVKHPTVIEREIVLKGCPMTVFFWHYPGHADSDVDPGCPAEIEIDSIYMDDYNVINLFGPKTMEEIEAELWKLLDEGEDV